MSKQKLHIILTSILVITLLLPIGIELGHSFKHSHIENCDDSSQFHTHDNEIDCSGFHYTLTPQTIDVYKIFKIYIPKTHKQTAFSLVSKFSIKAYIFKALRAPPSLII